MNLESPRTKNHKNLDLDIVVVVVVVAGFDAQATRPLPSPFPFPFPRRVPLAIRVDRCEGRICSFLLCAVILFVLLHHVEVIVGILAVVNVLKLLLLVLPSTAIKRLEEGEQRPLKRIHSTFLRLRLLRPLRRRHLALPAHECYILGQLAAPYSMAGTRTDNIFKSVCRAPIYRGSNIYRGCLVIGRDLLTIPIKQN